jgi:hypothetical protein
MVMPFWAEQACDSGLILPMQADLPKLRPADAESNTTPSHIERIAAKLRIWKKLKDPAQNPLGVPRRPKHVPGRVGAAAPDDFFHGNTYLMAATWKATSFHCFPDLDTGHRQRHIRIRRGPLSVASQSRS